MQGDQLLDILHLLIERHLQLLENLRNHTRTDYLMPMESPADIRVITFACRLADVMKERRPPQPYAR